MSITALQQMKAKRNGKVDIASLTRDMFEDKKILNRYFKFENKHLNRFHIPLLTKEEYEEQVKGYTGKITTDNMQYDSASSYFKRKMATERVAKDLGYSVKQLNFDNYTWNEDYFAYYDLLDSADYVDNKYKEEVKPDPTAHDVYIKFDTHQSTLDKELFEELYSFCMTAISKRKAMLLMKVEQCVSTLANIIEQTNGFTMNVSGNTLKTLKYYKAFFEEIYANEEFVSFIENNSDITVYAEDPDTHSDYVSTYSYMVKKLMNIKSEDTYMTEYLKCVLANGDDNYVDEIVETCFMIPDKPMRYVDELGDEEE